MSTMQQREMILSKLSAIDRRTEFLRSRGFADTVALTVWARRDRSLYIRRTLKAGVASLFARLTYRAPAVAVVLLAAISTVGAQQSDTAAPASDPASPQARQIFPNVRFLLDDPAIRGHVSPAENAWDFTDAHGMAGFGPLPDTQ